MDRIPELKAVLPGIISCTDLKKESATSYSGPCPVCGGDDRFVHKIDTDKCWCRICHEQAMDLIDFHCWKSSKTVSELMREYLPDDAATRQPTTYDLFSKRGLKTEVIRVLTETRGLKVTAHAGKQCVAVPYVTLAGEVKATQYLTIDQKPFPFTEKNRPANKVFKKGDKPGDECFFFAGQKIEQTDTLIICESAINAMTAFQWWPGACCIALGGSTYTRKLSALKQHLKPGTVIQVAQDNDPAGLKMLQAVEKIFPDRKVYSFAWNDSDKPGMDANDLLQAGQTDTPGFGVWVTTPPASDPQQDPATLINDAIARSATDPGAVYEPESLEAFQGIAATDPAAYARYRAAFKAANKQNSVTVLDKLVNTFGDAGGGDDSKADMLVELLQDRGTFFHNQDREPFVLFERDGHSEVWPLSSTGFQEWAGYTFFKEQGKTAGEATLKTATDSLAGLSKYEGEKHETFLRVATYGDGYAIDLCNESWSVVHIYPGGWEVLEKSPVKFWRTETMRAIPTPSKGDSCEINDIWRYLNIPEGDRLLCLAFILESFRPETPFVIAEFIAGQGSAKSTTQSNIRDLIDPNAVNLRAAPKTPEDIFVGAGNNWLASYNNLSHLSAQMQDALCTLATGGGFASRKLYTNFDEALLECKRPVMLNGISSLATAQDLIDRTIRFNLPEITEYKEETILQEQFEQDKPRILSGLYDLFAKTLENLPSVELKKPPRMADFARLGEAMARSLGYEPGGFIAQYEDARAQAIINALDGTPVALAIQDLLEDIPTGLDHVLIKNALKRLENYKPFGEAWPKSPRGLGDILRRIKPGLKAIGINVIFHTRTKKGVHVTIEPIPFFHEENKNQNQRTPHTPSTPFPITTGLSADKKGCTSKNQCTPDIHPEGQRTPDVHPTYTTENRVVTGKGVCGVRGACQNQTQIYTEKKGYPENQSTPDEVII